MLNLCANQNRTSMKTTLLVVGRTVEQHFITAINDYVQRTKRYLSFEMEVIPELKNTKSLSMEVQKEKEGELILKALQPGDVVVLLDEGGKEMRSIEFADYMKRKMNTVNKRLVFIIGGPYGFSPKVYEAAHEKMSLSRMTFSHQMVRLIFVEQLYRAMTILNGGRIIMNDEFQLRDTWNPLSESDISTNLALGFGTFSVKVVTDAQGCLRILSHHIQITSPHRLPAVYILRYSLLSDR